MEVLGDSSKEANSKKADSKVAYSKDKDFNDANFYNLYSLYNIRSIININECLPIQMLLVNKWYTPKANIWENIKESY